MNLKKLKNKPLYINTLKKSKVRSLPKRLAIRARSLFIGRTGGHINRTEKLTSILSRHGGRKKTEDAVLDLKIRIKEYFLPDSSADFLENLLIRLEPILDVKEVKAFKRKHSNRKFIKPKSFIVTAATATRRTRLGLGFFVKAVRLTQRKLQFTLATAMMTEVVALCSGLKCYSMRLKRDHIFKTLRFFNRFGGPVAVGSKLANRFMFTKKKSSKKNSRKKFKKKF